MKLSPFVLLASALAGRTISASDATMDVRATKNSMTLLRLKIFQVMQGRVRKFNNLKHGEKREISFDPHKLGCKFTSRRRLICAKAKINDHFDDGTQLASGIVVHKYE